MLLRAEVLTQLITEVEAGFNQHHLLFTRCS